jgi:hypothetical protein
MIRIRTILIVLNPNPRITGIRAVYTAGGLHGDGKFNQDLGFRQEQVTEN